MSANKCRRDKTCKCKCVRMRMRVRVRVRDLLLAPGFLLGSQLRLSLHLLRGGTERGERCGFHNHLQHLSEAACPAFKTCFGFAAINCSLDSTIRSAQSHTVDVGQRNENPGNTTKVSFPKKTALVRRHLCASASRRLAKLRTKTIQHLHVSHWHGRQHIQAVSKSCKPTSQLERLAV